MHAALSTCHRVSCAYQRDDRQLHVRVQDSLKEMRIFIWGTWTVVGLEFRASESAGTSQVTLLLLYLHLLTQRLGGRMHFVGEGEHPMKSFDFKYDAWSELFIKLRVLRSRIKRNFRGNVPPRFQSIAQPRSRSVVVLVMFVGWSRMAFKGHFCFLYVVGFVLDFHRLGHQATKSYLRKIDQVTIRLKTKHSNQQLTRVGIVDSGTDMHF